MFSVVLHELCQAYPAKSSFPFADMILIGDRFSAFC